MPVCDNVENAIGADCSLKQNSLYLSPLGLEMQNFPKSHYRHRTGTSEVEITGILPACLMLYYCVDLINTGNLPAACRYYRHAGNVVIKLCVSSLGIYLYLLTDPNLEVIQ